MAGLSVVASGNMKNGYAPLPSVLSLDVMFKDEIEEEVPLSKPPVERYMPTCDKLSRCLKVIAIRRNVDRKSILDSGLGSRAEIARVLDEGKGSPDLVWDLCDLLGIKPVALPPLSELTG